MRRRAPAPDVRAAGRTVLVAHPGAELYGSDRVMLESVAGFREAGWRVVVTLCDDGPLVAELRALGAEVRRTRSPVLRKSALRPAGFGLLVADTVLGAARGVALLGRLRPDAVYVSTVTVPLWTILARLMRRPVVVHVHEAETGAPAIVRRLMALPLVLATSVVVNSRFSVDVLRASLPAAVRRAVVVDNGVPGPAEVVPARRTIDGPVRLLYVGRLSARKGVDVAVEALAELHRTGCPARLDVVGAVFPGYEWFEQGLRDRVKELGLEGSVHLRGFHASVWPFLADADVAVVPSVVDEPFGNTAVEAVLAARPVVVSETSGLREASAGYGSAQQVRPGDPVALAGAVRRVRDAWPEFSRAAAADALTARDRHDPARYRGRAVAALEAAVSGAP
ncbi:MULTISPECIES: glycosyltransferase [unclassified Actinotalea]|uniref:glycosyltransferase n=1 Tax=unclassified Actinotalea TaxID=2638618 RepID=UPI0021056303|nr:MULTISPECIES: glycosyltransferase [unclassified Actinotalea]